MMQDATTGASLGASARCGVGAPLLVESRSGLTFAQPFAGAMWLNARDETGAIVGGISFSDFGGTSSYIGGPLTTTRRYLALHSNRWEAQDEILRALKRPWK